MTENVNALAVLYARAKELNPGLTQEEFGKRLNAIAQEKKWRGGFSAGGISLKLSDAALHSKSRYGQYETLMRTFAERNNLEIADALENFEKHFRPSASYEPMQDGIWQYLGHTHTKRNANEKSPSKEIRRALVKFEHGKAASIGVTTIWTGEYTVRGDIAYLQMVEPNENLEMFAILEKPTRRLAKMPRYQRGICSGAAFGEYEYRHPAIVSSRCVFRRLDQLSDLVSKTSSYWKDELRSKFCGYMSPSELRKRKLSYPQYSQLRGDDKVVREQYWYIDEIVRALYEDKTKQNFGNHIFLRN